MISVATGNPANLTEQEVGRRLMPSQMSRGSASTIAWLQTAARTGARISPSSRLHTVRKSEARPVKPLPMTTDRRAFFSRAFGGMLLAAGDSRGQSARDQPAGMPRPAYVPPGHWSLDDPAYARLYGPGTVVIDRLGYNYVMRRNGLDYAASHRFRALEAGVVSSLRIYTPHGTDGEYAGGDGGVLKIRICADDGSGQHYPDLSQPPLASGEFIPRLRNAEFFWRGDQFPLIPLDGTAPLKRGSLYHVVYEQGATDPAANFINVNSTATNEVAGRPMRWADPTDWASLYGTRPAGSAGFYTWGDAALSPYGGSFHVPILQINLGPATRFGCSVMESGNVESRQWVLTRGQSIREHFRPSAPLTVGAFSVCTAAELPGALAWSLTGEATLDSGTIEQATPNYRSIRSLIYQQGVFDWYDVVLRRPVILDANRTYDLIFTVADGSRWRFAVQRNGAQWGFQYPAAFWESKAQHVLDGDWTDAYMWDHRRSTSDQANWRVVLHRV
ncbi:MAG: hypothetical protein QM766_12730 [Burkholderiaceae bacterium]